MVGVDGNLVRESEIFYKVEYMQRIGLYLLVFMCEEELVVLDEG